MWARCHHAKHSSQPRLGVQDTLRIYAPWQWHSQYIGNYGHGQQVDKNSPTEGTLALVKVQHDDLLVKCPVPGRQRKINVYDNPASHEIFFRFRALNLDWKGENRLKTGGSMVNLKDNLVGKKLYCIKVLSSTYGHGVRYHIQVLSSAVLWSTNSWRVRSLSLPSLKLPVRWRLPLICSDPPQDEILFD